MKATKEEIKTGYMLGFSNEEIRGTARQCMKDNGYKLTPQGKELAISELESIGEAESYPVDLIIAVSTVIQTL